jgi:uncharacterized protein (DUF305 family)
MRYRSLIPAGTAPFQLLFAAVLFSACFGARGGNQADSSAAAAQTDHSAHTIPGLPAPVIPPGAMYSAEDVHFMQGMIPHHGQAVAMTALAVKRNASPVLIRLAQKMDLSQRAEIELMQRWLKERNQAIPDSNAHLHVQMPGMLTADQFKELEAASGKDFDKLFLTLMIQHHEGALKMVEDLFASPTAAQEPAVYQLATDIKVDQTAEIERMQELLWNL